MDAVMENIYGRRSVRSYKYEAPSDEIVKEIIKAGTYAANGGNTQGLRFVVIFDRKRLEKYSTVAKRLMVEGLKKQLGAASPEQAEHMKGMIRNLSRPEFNIFHDAPLAVMVFAAPSCLTPVEDASLAAGNMMLAAASMGLGSCWIGFATALQYDAEFRAETGVPADHRLIAPVILGYPEKAPGKGSRKEPQILKWVR